VALVTRTPADAIVVLGARILPDGRLGGAARRRVERAARAFSEGAAPFVVCAGGQRWDGHIEALAMRRSLQEMGLETTHVLAEIHSRTTAENALYCSRIFRSFGWRHAAVVTCPWHLPRARRDVRRCGLQVTGVAAQDLPAPNLQVAQRFAGERVGQVMDSARLAARYLW